MELRFLWMCFIIGLLTACRGGVDEDTAETEPNETVVSTPIPVTPIPVTPASTQPTPTTPTTPPSPIPTPALSGVESYTIYCAGCHGGEGEGNTNTALNDGVCSILSSENCGNQNALASYIEQSMPIGTQQPQDCVGECANNIAAYILELVEQNANEITAVQTGSWNLDLEACSSALPGESQRLAPKQISNVIEEVFGQSIVAQAALPLPSTGAGFSTSIAANRIAQGDVRSISEYAEEIALALMGQFPSLTGCNSSLTDTCARDYIEELTDTIFRGVYSSQDVDRFQNLYNALRSGNPVLNQELALAGVVSGMLQSPAFLYLLEIGEANGNQGERVLTDREIANRIALILTNSIPDATLLTAAENGSLRNAQSRQAQAERLMARSQSQLPNFLSEWFGVNHNPDIGLSSNQVSALVGEFERVVEQTITDDLPVSSLFFRDTTFVNQDLAEHYGMSVNTQGGWVEAPAPNERRAGLLSTGIVAISHSNLQNTSVVQRGHFVREYLLCAELPSPPPGATDQVLPLPEDPTVRDRIEARVGNVACGGCHGQMDYIGLGMEDLDDLGQFRNFYDQSGHVVDENGELSNLLVNATSNTRQDSVFQGTSALGQLLSESPATVMCVRQKWHTYAMGRDDLSVCHAASLGEPDIADSPSKLVSDLVGSESFILRTDSIVD